MKSRITIEVDFENNNSPVIQILKASSDDVRDKLVSAFTEQVGGSSWLNIKWDDNTPEGFQKIILSAIPPHRIKEQSEIMLEQHRVHEQWMNQNKYDTEHFYNTGELLYIKK